MDTNFNHEQSLSLINEMINRARNNVKQEGTYSLMYWGYMTALLAIINYVLLQTLNDPNQSFWIWVLMLPAGLGSYFIERRADKRKLVKTHLDKIASIVWFGFLISFGIFTVIIHSVNSQVELSQIFLLNTPVIMSMVGMGQFISACIYRHKMWYAIAALTWTGAVVCALLQVDMQFIVFAACMILGFSVPGHILNYQAKKSHV
jgi:MFS family permease